MGLPLSHLLPVDPVLTEYAQRYSNDSYVADLVFPPLVKIGQRTGQIPVWDKSNMLVESGSTNARAINREAKRILSSDVGYFKYATTPHAEKVTLGQTELEIWAAGGQDADKLRFSKTGLVTDHVMLQREQDLATFLTTTTNYASSSYYAAASAVYTDPNASDPIKDIRTGMTQLSKTAARANYAVCDQDVMDAMSVHPAFLNFFHFVQGGSVSPEDMEKVFPGLKWIVASARAHDGVSTWSRVWGSGIVLFRKDNKPMGINTGRTIISDPFSVIEIPEPKLDHGGAVDIEAQMDYVHTPTAVDDVSTMKLISAYYISGCIS
jgi:hypothetical protein